jgi:hypothetical protein
VWYDLLMKNAEKPRETTLADLLDPALDELPIIVTAEVGGGRIDKFATARFGKTDWANRYVENVLKPTGWYRKITLTDQYGDTHTLFDTEA